MKGGGRKGSFGEMVVLFELKKIKKKKQVGEREACEFGQHKGRFVPYSLQHIYWIRYCCLMETNPPGDTHRMNRTWGKMRILGGLSDPQ